MTDKTQNPKALSPKLSASAVENLRVFYLTGELNAVSKEATEHAEARAKLLEERERLVKETWALGTEIEEGHHEIARLVDELRAVRVLDAWAYSGRTWYCGQVETSNPWDFRVYLVWPDGKSRDFYARTPAEARAAAAKALLEEDPTLLVDLPP